MSAPIRLFYTIEPPFNFKESDGTVRGCDIELAQYVLAALGLGELVFVETEFAGLLPSVAMGRWQMTTGLFNTPERREIASFNRPIWALSDGLLVEKSNPLGLTGYRSVASNSDCILAVVRDQFQTPSAAEFGAPAERIAIFESYAEAAHAVAIKQAHAYASVARAHFRFIELNIASEPDVVTVPSDEKRPSFGAFGFNRTDAASKKSVDDVLDRYSAVSSTVRRWQDTASRI